MRNFLVYSGLLILVATLLIFSGFKWLDNNNNVSEGNISIYEGASVKQVADILEVNGNIESSSNFYLYIKAKQALNKMNIFSKRPFEVSFKAGEFEIKEGDFDSLIHTLNEIRNVDTSNYAKITFPEGIGITEIGETLDKENILIKEDFFEKINDKDYYSKLKKEFLWLPEYNSDRLFQLEGFLQANTYEFREDSPPEDVIEKMLEGTNNWYKKHKVDLVDKNVEFHQLITLASIIERESKYSEDRPKVSKVFYNRMKEGMPLQSDITATYALGVHKTFVTYEDIDIDSPYNTYKTKGLPIGAISSPSEESFDAALHPEKNFDYLYFYARPTGETFYSNTLEEHQIIIDKYEKEWLDL